MDIILVYKTPGNMEAMIPGKFHTSVRIEKRNLIQKFHKLPGFNCLKKVLFFGDIMVKLQAEL